MARLIRAVKTTRLCLHPFSLLKNYTPYEALYGMYRIYSIKLATNSNKGPSRWEENVINAQPRIREYPSDTPHNTAVVKVGLNQTMIEVEQDSREVNSVAIVL